MKLKTKILTIICSAWIASAVHADTLTVTNTDLTGPGSFSEAINSANSDPLPTKIVFAVPQGGRIITGHHGWFPAITTPVDIDGTNEGGLVTLVGSAPTGPGSPVNGLEFETGSENSRVSGINTEGFLNAVMIKTDYICVLNSHFTKAFARGIRIENSTGSLVEFNTFDENDAMSINVDNSSGAGILSNSVNSGTVIIRNSDNISVGVPERGNIFDNNSYEGAVQIYGDGTGNSVMGNTIKNQEGNGIIIAADSQISSSIVLNEFDNNTGWDIKISGAKNPSINLNTISGDSFAMNAGIFLEGVDSADIQGNTLDGARISLSYCNGALIGGVGSDKNTIENDPQGFSASAAVILKASTGCEVVYNSINNNGSNGILIDGSFNNTLWANSIFDNGRTGIKILSGDRNKMGRNIIYGHHADAMGGINSISLLGNANNGKEAPVITSIERINQTAVIVSGIGEPFDRIELFRSSKATSRFSYDAIAELGYSAVSSDSTWSAHVNISDITTPELYVTATASQDMNSSELAAVEGIILTDGIAGPAEITRGLAYTYAVKELSGVRYDWWVNGDASVEGNGSNSVKVIFNNKAGSTVKLSVGYTDPDSGWTVKTIDVTLN